MTCPCSPLPAFLPPGLDPRVPPPATLTNFLGAPVRGNWRLALATLVFLLLNVLGEELWWRGYILPRQELARGRWTWVIHGLLWDLFHVFWKWELLMLLPGALAVAFVAQRTTSTWPGLIAHLFINGPVLILVLASVLGMAGRAITSSPAKPSTLKWKRC